MDLNQLKKLRDKLKEHLGITDLDGVREIRKKYLRWIVKNNPDKGGDQETFKKVKGHYEELMDFYKKNNMTTDEDDDVLNPDYADMNEVLNMFDMRAGEKKAKVIPLDRLMLHIEGHS